MKSLNTWFVRSGLRWSPAAVAAALFIPCLLGQSSETNDAWTEIQDSALNAAAGSADRATIYQLDTVRFDGFLRRAPAEGSGAPSLVVGLPMPDGVSMLFRVEESPLMDPALAARFPAIRTFTLRGVDDPSITGRMDRNHRNLHALLLTGQGAVQINPDAQLEHPHYRSVYEKTSASDLFCGVDETIPNLVRAARSRTANRNNASTRTSSLGGIPAL